MELEQIPGFVNGVLDDENIANVVPMMKVVSTRIVHSR
jgi:hypothetical protein